eukprot:1893587-Pleurochrysis_carterae.AAC.2
MKPTQVKRLRAKMKSSAQDTLTAARMLKQHYSERHVMTICAVHGFESSCFSFAWYHRAKQQLREADQQAYISR